MARISIKAIGITLVNYRLPDLRDVGKIVEGCSSLPKEAAENKKLFTRLWVHEALRCFYDRLKEPREMDAVFNCIRQCVRSIFRENFDSAFEHLGKIDGQVTQVNLRNLLFGRYLPNENGQYQFGEVQGFDQYEKVLSAVLKKHNDENPQQEINIIPIRYTLEMISHINHVITTAGGHALLNGQGGDGRTTATRVAALLTGHTYFNLPVCGTYTRESWRKDLKKLVSSAGFNSQETVIYVPATQLTRHSFILEDIDSLLGRGEVSGLFTTKEKHQINEFVHKYLFAKEEGKVNELTPAAIYQIFIDLCKEKLHVVISFNVGEGSRISKIFRKHKSIMSVSTEVNFRVSRCLSGIMGLSHFKLGMTRR